MPDQRTGNISRPGALQSWPFRQSQRTALIEFHGHIIFIGDSSFAIRELAHAIVRQAALISRLRLDANLFAPPPERTSASLGRPAQKGSPLTKLKTLLSNSATRRTRIIVSAWYGHVSGKALEITSGTPCSTGRAPRSCRSDVLVRDPDEKRDPQAFFSTDVTIEPADIIALYVRRGQIKVSFTETPPTWASRHSVNGPTKLSLEPRRHSRFSSGSATLIRIPRHIGNRR